MENCLQNRVLLAGLLFAIRLTDDLAQIQPAPPGRDAANAVEPVRLDLKILQKVQRETDRLASAYRPSFVLIEILLQSQGLFLNEAEEDLTLPGFLFDMNRFFQALLSRFLRENLTGYTVRDEYRLKGMITYRPGFNPKNRRVPQLRPDYMVFRDGRVAAILDAKYRDLWEHPLPREMLYQLTVYALSQEAGIPAAILYPTVDAAAKEAVMDINDPAFGRSRARLYLRPVNLLYLSELITVGYREQAPGLRPATCLGEPAAIALYEGLWRERRVTKETKQLVTLKLYCVIWPDPPISVATNSITRDVAIRVWKQVSLSTLRWLE